MMITWLLGRIISEFFATVIAVWRLSPTRKRNSACFKCKSKSQPELSFQPSLFLGALCVCPSVSTLFYKYFSSVSLSAPSATNTMFTSLFSDDQYQVSSIVNFQNKHKWMKKCSSCVWVTNPQATAHHCERNMIPVWKQEGTLRIWSPVNQRKEHLDKANSCRVLMTGYYTWPFCREHCQLELTTFTQRFHRVSFCSHPSTHPVHTLGRRRGIRQRVPIFKASDPAAGLHG